MSKSKFPAPEFFKALADPSRLALLEHIAKKKKSLTVTQATCCCNIDFSVVSRHLKQLNRAGILDAQKEGKTVEYSLRSNELATMLRTMADAIEACCPQKQKKGGT